MKVIIPAAGIGKRLRPLTNTIPKVLVPVAGKPMLGHLLDRIQPLNPTEVIFITGFMGERVQEYVQETYPSLSSVFIHQAEQNFLASNFILITT